MNGFISVALRTSAFVLCCCPPQALAAPSLPARDERALTVRTLNTPRTFPVFETRDAWRDHARYLRDHVLVSCGLWPLPERAPLHARIFDRVDHADYTVEKVLLETYPGFFLGGNLYRPAGRGPGPFPGILNPHGHWKSGRLEDGPAGSIPARCINFAKQGMVAFAYDMVGYNDTAQVNHQFANQPAQQLWNISLMGLQTWNSIRAVDFLSALPYVDAARLACTGASGGGTQTFMLGAVEDRLAVLAPMVMVSHTMQGGCLCENAPGLRVDASNMELSAAAAPRPQLLVAATGDWTRDTMTVEGPSIASIYRLFDAEDHFRHTLFDFPHNYNLTTREEVYRWFGRWLRQDPEADSLKESSYVKDDDALLLALPKGEHGPGAKTEVELIDALREVARNQWAALKPSHPQAWTNYQRVAGTAWRHLLQWESSVDRVWEEARAGESHGATKGLSFDVGRPGRGDRLPVQWFHPDSGAPRRVVVLIHPEGQQAYLDDQGRPFGLASALIRSGQAVVLGDVFLTGSLADKESQDRRKPTEAYFTTYNRTDLQERVQDIATIAAWCKQRNPKLPVVLCGAGAAGLWTLLAATAADAVVADTDHWVEGDENTLMRPDWFTPGLLRYGELDGAAALAAPRPMFAHQVGAGFSMDYTRAAYGATASPTRFHAKEEAASVEEIVAWISKL